MAAANTSAQQAPQQPHSCSRPECGHHDEAEEDPEVLEQRALGKIIFAFRQYAQCTEMEICRWEQNYRALSARHRTILSHLPAKAAAARQAVQQNQLFVKALLMDFAEDAAEHQHDCDGYRQGCDGADGGAGVPDDLASGAIKVANVHEASGQHCAPGDAEKVSSSVYSNKRCRNNQPGACLVAWTGCMPLWSFLRCLVPIVAAS
eukprot:GHRR01033258.1.p1 GENE.GHRR01033258.1~~GHRR01033258.1.p1  ORF type:complete len:205 (+),score=56.10 GHRR01033258.1:394-1008(+)